MIDTVLMILGSVLSILCTILVYMFKSMKDDLHEISKSVQELNQQIARVVTDQAWHKEKIDKLEIKIGQVETRLQQE